MLLFQPALRKTEEVGKMGSGGSFSPSCHSSFPHEWQFVTLPKPFLPNKSEISTNAQEADVKNPCSQAPSWMHSVISHKAPIEQWALICGDQERGTGTAPTSPLRVFTRICVCVWYFYFWSRSNWNLLRAVSTTKNASEYLNATFCWQRW